MSDIETSPRAVSARVRARYQSLPEAERKVADAVEHDAKTVVRLPVRALAARIGVSEATIVRFCRSVGYEGLRDLKLQLAAETLSPTAAAYEEIADADAVPTIVEKVIRADMQALADTLAVLDQAALDATVTAILDAPRVEWYGVGSSVPIVLDGYHRLLRLGFPTSVVTDAQLQAASAAHLPAGAVAFAVSHTGRSIETERAISWARRAGARCILLTSHQRTPIGRLADIEIVTASPASSLHPESGASRIAHLAVIDAISIALAAKRREAAGEALLTYQEVIAEHLLDDR
jgi:RpiR family transcriptional regulator, carbohydrate utilization regulator